MNAVHVMLLAVAAGLADPPRVEIQSSRGALEGPNRGPPGSTGWERVRLTLDIRNHLDVPVRDLVLDVALLESGAAGSSGEAIPGWAFRELAVERTLPPNSTVRVELERALPDRRRSPPADEVTYRARIRSYRVDRPVLELVLELLGSSHASDQRSALRSFDLDPAWTAREVSVMAVELRSALLGLPVLPAAPDALRLLLALRAVGSLALAGEVPLLLALPERLDREAWGRAVLDLASRMVIASAPDDPRLRVLPRWARRVATLLGVNASDAVEEATREAIAVIGDAAVPELVRTAALDARPRVRARALKLLELLGRATPRAQLASRAPAVRQAVAEALGALGDPAAVPALVDALAGGERIAEAARRALLALGEAAILPLCEALGGRGVDAKIEPILLELGAAHPRTLTRAAAALGLEAPSGPPSEVVARLSRARAADRVARLEAEIEVAIALGAEGAHRSALERLEQVYTEDPELYMRHADPIARLYLARGEALLARGDYEAALRVLMDGQAVKRLPEAESRITDARVALAHGFLELGELDRAGKELDAAVLRSRADVLATRSSWLAASARRALDEGRRGEARRFVDRGRALDPGDFELGLLHRRLLLGEHLAVVLVVAGCVPSLLLVALVRLKRHLDRRSMERLARAVDALP